MLAAQLLTYKIYVPMPIDSVDLPDSFCTLYKILIQLKIK